jgi:hypothetical protein
MLAAILSILIFALMSYDVHLTTRRIKDYGPQVELSPSVQMLARRFGAEWATLISVAIPNILLLFVLNYFEATTCLGFILGFKLRFFYNQIESLKFEKDAKAVAKLINSRGGVLPPPSQHIDANASSSQAAPQDSKKD